MISRSAATEVLQRKKERNRATLNRPFVGDYIKFGGNPKLKLLARGDRGRKVKMDILFADDCYLYDAKFKQAKRILLLSDSEIIFLGADIPKEGPEKGKAVMVVKYRIPHASVLVITLSMLADNFLVIKYQDELEVICSTRFKTELVATLAQQLESAGKKLALTFSNE